MNRTIKLTYAGIVAAVAIVVALLLVPNYAGASSGLEPCVPKDAYTETVVVTPAIPAVPAVPGTPEIPGVPAVPAVPGTDPVYETRVITPAVEGGHYSWNGGNLGVTTPPTVVPPHEDWQLNTDGEPAGHLNSATWYPLSNPVPGVGLHVIGNSPSNASWFYNVPDVPAVTEEVLVTPGTEGTPEIPAIPAVPATEGTPGSPAVPAVTKDIFHPAVVCTTPSETPTVTPPVVTETVVPPVVTETVVPTPTPDDVQTPEVTPIPEDNPVPVKVTTAFACVDGVWVTLVKKGDEVISKTESGSCVETSQNRKFVRAEETGL